MKNSQFMRIFIFLLIFVDACDYCQDSENNRKALYIILGGLGIGFGLGLGATFVSLIVFQVINIKFYTLKMGKITILNFMVNDFTGRNGNVNRIFCGNRNWDH